MRTFALLAAFLLAVASIVEGAVIVRLSSRVETLSQRLASDSGAQGASGVLGSTDVVRVAAARNPSLPTSTLPRLLPAPASDAPPAAAATVLREALETPEGRQHLKAAMEVLREQDRQERVTQRAERAVDREQQRVQQMTHILALTSEEQGKVGQLYSSLQASRRRVLDEMHAGQKDADQADNEIDGFRDETDRSVRALLGEPRMQKFRETMRAQRRRGGNEAGPPAPPPGGALPK